LIDSHGRDSSLWIGIACSAICGEVSAGRRCSCPSSGGGTGSGGRYITNEVQSPASATPTGIRLTARSRRQDVVQRFAGLLRLLFQCEVSRLGQEDAAFPVRQQVAERCDGVFGPPLPALFQGESTRGGRWESDLVMEVRTGTSDETKRRTPRWLG
jgi:hypothetical protein